MTKAEAAVAIIGAVRDSIRELGSVPSGHLYATLMGSLTLSEYQTIVDILRAEGSVKLNGNVLDWVGQ